ncbi:MAG: hypothetical protein A2126_03485 [Candidatus Woykebacteria bacterium GWB1_45_5]|uniref:DUF5668 domain-containing protein n=2 Tax=Candidatus Woykeibacteriota TaxID=1817899 RepID=A0A1G1W4G2_9BACT|nr:MAG: hypothetical protein A2113_03250 [Candidatus Woykebacteria bacterium GWA1_44_8]OGY24485.1 MAG: hypothetical protein A2126_03485 [Candidatus Woykebacteria bacterium GWB1_45_5]
MKKGLKIGPAILISLGIVFLLNNFGVLPWDIWTNLWKFWPVLLILVGIEAFIGQSVSIKTLLVLLFLIFLIPVAFAINPFTKNPLATETLPVSEPLGSLAKSKIIIDLPATNLDLKAVATGSSKLIEGKISFSKAANKPKISKEEVFGKGVLTISQEGQTSLPFVSSLKNNTQLALSQQIPLELLIKAGAAAGNIDLSNLRVDYLEIDSKATTLKIIFGKLYSTRAVLKAGAASLEIQIPPEIATRLKVDSKVKNLSVPPRFEKNGAEYKTKEFDKAFTRLDIEINAAAGTITIK